MKTRNVFFLAMIALITTACGGGGGGSASAPSDGGGGCVVNCGGDGGANGGGQTDSFKGYSTDGSRVEGGSGSEPTSGDYAIFPNVGYIEYWDATNKSFDMMVKNPTCLLGAAYEDYALTKVVGGTHNQISIQRTSGQVVWTEHAISALRTDTSTATIASSCMNGLTTIAGSFEFYANGQVIVLRTVNNDVYFGIRDTSLINSGSFSGNFQQYLSISIGDDNTAGSITMSGGGSVSSVVNMIQLNGNVNTGFSTNVLNYHANGNGSTTHHISLQNQHGWMMGIFGTLGGKKVMVTSLPKDAANDCDSSGCYTVGQFILAVEE